MANIANITNMAYMADTIASLQSDHPAGLALSFCLASPGRILDAQIAVSQPAER